MYPASEVQVVLLRDMGVFSLQGRPTWFFRNLQRTWSMPRGAGMLKPFHTLDHPPSLVVIGGKLGCVGRITGGGLCHPFLAHNRDGSSGTSHADHARRIER